MSHICHFMGYLWAIFGHWPFYTHNWTNIASILPISDRWPNIVQLCPDSHSKTGKMGPKTSIYPENPQKALYLAKTRPTMVKHGYFKSIYVSFLDANGYIMGRRKEKLVAAKTVVKR